MPGFDEPFVASLAIEQRGMWEKLAQFSFEADGSGTRFLSRLALENGWSIPFAQRVLVEYRRFLFLTAVAGHPVCPSEEVDAAWHQHLIFSRSYWTELCDETLGYPLHHDPSAGGPDDGRKYWEMYRKTLDSYRRVFCEEPPREIWPLPFERFDPCSQIRVVNMRDHWVLAKPIWWPRRLPRRPVMAAGMVPITAVGLGPFDLTGPEFLVVFFGLSLLLLIGSYIYSRIQRSLNVNEDHELSAEEIACLKFGEPAAVNAAVAQMLHDHELMTEKAYGFLGQVNGAKIRFRPGDQATTASDRSLQRPTVRPAAIELESLIKLQKIPASDGSLKSSILRAVADEPKTLVQLQKSLVNETAEIKARIEEAGYLLNQTQRFTARMVPGLLMCFLLVFGIIKVAVGLERNRPVIFLILGLIAVLITFLTLIFSIRRSLAGDQMVRTLESQHHCLRTSPLTTASSGNQVALGAALFGSAALSGPALEDLKSAWKSTTPSGTYTGSDGGGGCGGGAGGCGGGGGGGCGGGGGGGCGGGGCGGGGGG